MRALRNQGRAPGDTWLQHTYLGYNYRLDEMSAALGRVQMERLEELLAKRERVAGWLRRAPGGPSRASRRPGPCQHLRMSWFVYVVRFAAGIDRDHVAQSLKERASRPTLLHPDPLAALHGRALRLPGGRLPGHEDLGRARACRFLFQR